MAQEILLPGSTAPQVANYGNRNTTQIAVTQQYLQPPGTLVDKATGNAYALVPGSYNQYIQKGPSTIVGSPGTTFTSATFSNSSQVSNCSFHGVVALTAAASTIFTNCTFTSVACTVGAKARFHGCRFSGNVNNTGGVITDVVLYGCLGGSSTNCTVY